MTIIRRKLYKRGSSVETTIPKPLLFALDMNKKYDVMFNYDHIANRWYIDFKETETKREKGQAGEKEEKNNPGINHRTNPQNKPPEQNRKTGEKRLAK